jgi:hypothetical protein
MQDDRIDPVVVAPNPPEVLLEDLEAQGPRVETAADQIIAAKATLHL